MPLFEAPASLRRRVVVLLVAGAALFTAVAGAFTWATSHRRALEAGRHTLDDLMTAVEKTAAVGAFTGDRMLLQEVIDGLERTRLVAAVRVVDAGGRVLASGAAAPGDRDGVLARPLRAPFPPNAVIGTLEVQADRRQLDRQARRDAATLTALLAAQVALVAWVLHVAVSRHVSRPIVQLAGRLRALQPGTGERLDVPARHARDEVGVLIAGANALLDANADALERERALRADVERMQARVQHEAEHDALTGLRNRRASHERIDRILAEAAAGGAPAVLMFVDLDGFKGVNDTHGHSAGDAVLAECARRMRAVARRSSDLVGRLGGDEFVVMLPHTGEADAYATGVAACLVEALGAPFALPDGGTARIGASIGMAAFPRHGSRREPLEARADEALYAVKRAGRRSYAMAVA